MRPRPKEFKPFRHMTGKQSPLERLVKRKGTGPLTPELLNAAETFEGHFMDMLAAPDVKRTFDWLVFENTEWKMKDAKPGEVVPRVWFEHARPVEANRFETGLRFMRHDLGNAAFRLIILQHPIEKIEKDFGWAARSAKVVLSIALQHLTEFYKDLPDGS